MLFYKLLFCSFLCVFSLGFTQTSWPINVEREVDEGTYMSVYASFSGWRIWKTETKNGISCKAVKSAKGKPHPIPVGVNSALYRGTPFLTVLTGYKDRVVYSWSAEHYGNVSVKIRIPGEKFWDEYRSSSVDMQKYQEKRIEISLISWEYPEIYVGLSEQKGIFELIGIKKALSEIDKCENVQPS